MEQDALKGQMRQERGTGAVRRLRHAGKVPGVIYAKGESTPIFFDNKVLEHYLAKSGKVVNIDLDGSYSKAVIKEIQFDPTTDALIHIDLHRVSLTERIEVSVKVAIKGALSCPPDKGMLERLLDEIPIECLPQDVPAEFVVDISELQPGDSVHIRDVEFQAGMDVKLPEDAIVVAVIRPTEEAEEEVPEEIEPVGEESIAGEKKEEKKETG